MKKFYKNYIFYVLIVFCIVLFTIIGVMSIINSTDEKDYSFFLEQIEKETILTATYDKEDSEFKIKLKDNQEYSIPNPQTDEFKEYLLINNIDVTQPISFDVEIMIYLVTFIAMVVFFFVFYRKMILKNNPMTNGGMKNKLYSIDMLPNVNFDSVAGNEEAKENLKDIVQFLNDPMRFKKFGAKCPKGVLLHGAPGIGKTLLARAMAGEAKVPFINVSGSDFTEMYVGVGASRVRELFKIAREKAPCILFIDEIDAIGRKRSMDSNSNDEKDNTLNQLLVELDGFNGMENILVIGATNRYDILDDAFRSGRFDRQIQLLPPDRKARESIIRVHLNEKPIASNVDVEKLGRLTNGMSGADIENAINEGAIIAAKNSLTSIMPGVNSRMNGIEMDDLIAGVNKVLYGDERRNLSKDNEVEKIITAWHEAGHAVIAYLLGRNVEKATIVPTTKGMGGYTKLSSEDASFITKKEILENIEIAFAGRVGEELYNELVLNKTDSSLYITNGAANDIEIATKSLEALIVHYGMGKKYYNVSGKRLIENDIIKSNAIEEEIVELSIEITENTRNLLKQYFDILKNLAEDLLEKETLYEEEINEILIQSIH